MTDTTTTIVVDADQIVAEARRALTALDGAIAAKRQERKACGAEIALLLEDRKPLARIVSAMEPRKPRTRKSQDNGDQA